MNIVLASASERRQELLKRLVENFEILVSSFDESSVAFEGDIEEYVLNIAEGKAKDVDSKCGDDKIIISADTIVVKDEKILGKPMGANDATKMLKELQGTAHYVYTAIVIIDQNAKKTYRHCEKTKVYFSQLSISEIYKYIETGEPLDKAGAYGIQGYGGAFVEKIEGCYYNVVGLPLNKLKKMLDNI